MKIDQVKISKIQMKVHIQTNQIDLNITLELHQV